MNMFKSLFSTVKMIWLLLSTIRGTHCHSVMSHDIVLKHVTKCLHFSVISIHLWSCTLQSPTQPASVSLTSNISWHNISAISHFMSQRRTPLCSAALLWFSIVLWPLLTLQGVQCPGHLLNFKALASMGFKCPPVQHYSMPSCLLPGGHFASNGGEAAEASSH